MFAASRRVKGRLFCAPVEAEVVRISLFRQDSSFSGHASPSLPVRVFWEFLHFLDKFSFIYFRFLFLITRLPSPRKMRSSILKKEYKTIQLVDQRRWRYISVEMEFGTKVDWQKKTKHHVNTHNWYQACCNANWNFELTFILEDMCQCNLILLYLKVFPRIFMFVTLFPNL